jgi:8-oxo-dGTP pyrophosphatase MutT (NUDIX family)
MSSAELVGAWILERTISDVPHLLRNVQRAYVHPYGFHVLRLALPDLAPWTVRLHVWPNPIEIYARMHHTRSENQLIHSHGWDLLSMVLAGELDESTYELSNSRDGNLYTYVTPSFPSMAGSNLTFNGKRQEISTVVRRTRSAIDGIYSIPRGTYHATLPARSSISLVATNQQEGQESYILMRDPDTLALSNSAPDVACDYASLLRLTALAEPEVNWGSFLFLCRADEVLLLRTKVRPDQWHPVGGRKDPDDASPIATLIREAKEEIGLEIDVAMLTWLGSYPADEGAGSTCIWRLQQSEKQRPFAVQESEILEIQWWPLSEASNLPMYPGAKNAIQLML